MAYYFNGVNYAYDYSEMLNEFKEDIEDGYLSNDTIINIVRSKKKIAPEIEYYPLIDYYYLDDLKNLQEPLENFHNKEEFSKEEWAKMVEENEVAIKQYKEDEPFFEKATVLAVITEMEQWNK